MLIQTHKYALGEDASLSIDICHNRARVHLMVWDTQASDWITASKTAYAWEDASELLNLAIDLAEKHAPDLVADLQDLFSHPDFMEPEND